MRRSLQAIFIFLVLSAGAAFGQIAGLPSGSTASTSAQSHTEPAVPPDPLGRETPRGCVLGFVKAAQEEDYRRAVEYFQPQPVRRRHSEADEEELVAQLLAILNQKFAGPLDFLSKDPQGRLDDNLPPDQERLSGALGNSPDKFPILLIRQEDGEGRKLWYIARSTLEQVPEMYESLTFPEIEKKIPQTLVTHRLLAMPLWQWLAFLLFIPVALFVGRLLIYLTIAAINRWHRLRGQPPLLLGHKFLQIDPVSMAAGILLHYWFVSYIGTSLLYRLYYRRLIWIFLAIAFYWILTRITRAISARIGASLTRRGLLAERSIVSLIRRFIEVSIFLFVSLMVLRSLGVDVSTALAGVGIGGLAIGLGAQKTFENMFGGVSLLFDKVIQIGDTCRVNNQTGVVEDIGLRSTRLRTGERTLLSIPNGVMSTVTLENLRFRDKFLCQQILRLRYDLSPDHVRFVLEEFRRILLEDSKVEDPSSRVRLIRFSDYAIEIEIFCYILEPDFAQYLATQEALFLKLMEAIDKAGAVVALPTQATLVTQDAWVNTEKAKAAQAAVEKARDAGVPGTNAANSKD